MKQEKQIKTINILHIDGYDKYGGAQKSTVNSLKAIKLALKLSQSNSNLNSAAAIKNASLTTETDLYNNCYNNCGDSNKKSECAQSQNSKYNFNFYVIHNNNKVYEEELNNLNIPNFSIKMKNFGDIFAIIRISKFLIKYKINIIVFHSSKDHVLGGIACFLSGRKIIKILTRHVAYNISFLKGFLIYHLLTDHYIAISKYIKNILIDDLKINPDKITVIYDIRFTDDTAGTDAAEITDVNNNDIMKNLKKIEIMATEITDINHNDITDTNYIKDITGINNIEAARSDKIKNYATKELNISEGMKIVSIIGRLSNEKGHATFLNAASSIIKKRKDIKFIIVGDGDLYGSINEFITNNKLSDYIIMTGFQKDVEQYIKASDLIIVPSGLEGLGGIIVESCMQKKAVIASNVGGIPEIIDDGLTGILFEKDNFHELADKIINVIDNKRMLDKLGNNCYKKMAEEFNPRKLAEKNINLYLKLLKLKTLNT